jgi:hypothetical protein
VTSHEAGLPLPPWGVSTAQRAFDGFGVTYREAELAEERLRYASRRRAAAARSGADVPPGQTCADCAHVERCVAIFGQKPTDTACQFNPRRFLARARRSP